MLSEPIQITLKVVKVFDRLEIPYLIGGSLASAVHGIIRATMDADLVADIHPAKYFGRIGPAGYPAGFFLFADLGGKVECAGLVSESHAGQEQVLSDVERQR